MCKSMAISEDFRGITVGIEKYNIDETEVIRKALMKEVKKAKAKELEKEIKGNKVKYL
ncbi:MAG: hypothetical protein RXR03_03245 [Thermocladium sp.]